jgi:cytidylate kinase
MLIILEGNECNFKSTVAEKLSNLIGFNVVKGSSFEMSKTTNEELFNKFNQLSNLNRTIIDRFIYSNLVYASLYKD